MTKNSLFIFLMILTACTTTLHAQSPAEFNNNLSSRADSFFHLGAMWGSKLESIAGGSKHYEDLKPFRLKAVDYIDLQVSELGSMKDVKDSRDLRIALIEILNFEKTLINNEFMRIEKLSPLATEKEMQLAFAGLEDASKKEEPYLMRLTQAQDAYAKNNGFKAEHGEEKR